MPLDNEVDRGVALMSAYLAKPARVLGLDMTDISPINLVASRGLSDTPYEDISCIHEAIYDTNRGRYQSE